MVICLSLKIASTNFSDMMVLYNILLPIPSFYLETDHAKMIRHLSYT